MAHQLANFLYFAGWCVIIFMIFIIGWAVGYREGIKDQKMTIARLRKAMRDANS